MLVTAYHAMLYMSVKLKSFNWKPLHACADALNALIGTTSGVLEAGNPTDTVYCSAPGSTAVLSWPVKSNISAEGDVAQLCEARSYMFYNICPPMSKIAGEWQAIRVA